MGVCCVDWPHVLVSNKQVARTTRLQHFTQFRKKGLFIHFFVWFLSVYVCMCVCMQVLEKASDSLELVLDFSFMPPDMNAGY